LASIREVEGGGKVLGVADVFLPPKLAPEAGKRENRRVKTLKFAVDPCCLTTSEANQALDCAAALLRAGKLVALPTETVYGLGANALNAEAVASIFRAKERPSWDPVIVHIADLSQLDELVESVPDSARRLMKAFWPGPLTLLLPRSKLVGDAVTAGRRLVGVRMPAHPVALELIRRAGVPVAAPSANLFSHISPTTAAHVLADLDGRIDAVLDAGQAAHGVESTVLDPNQTPMIVYRPGAVTVEQIRAAAGAAELYQPEVKPANNQPREALPSPGVGIRHYAPRARLVLVESSSEAFGLAVEARVAALKGKKVGLLLPEGFHLPQSLQQAVVFNWGSWLKPEELAHRLYAGLRALDDAGVAVIYCPKPAKQGVGAALLDRLGKATYRESDPV